MVIEVCDTCVESAEEDGAWGMDDGDIATILRDMGSEISDHLCDEIETDGEAKCGCSCKRRLKRQLRNRKQ
jgi:hypothetical protein